MGAVSKFTSDPKTSHLIATKTILRYLKGTKEFGLLFPKGSSDSVAGLDNFSN